MKNKQNYQKTFSRLTASEDTIMEVLKMDHNKKYRHIQKSTAVIAAALLLLSTTGVAYAATDGDISKLWEKITFTINGKDVAIGDYLKTDEDGTSYLSYEDKNVSYSITADPSSLPENWDCNLSIDTSAANSEVTIVEYPFTLVPEGDKLYFLQNDTSEKIDITKEAASKEGYHYTWKSPQSTELTAIISGTPEKYFVNLA